MIATRARRRPAAAENGSAPTRSPGGDGGQSPDRGDVTDWWVELPVPLRATAATEWTPGGAIS